MKIKTLAAFLFLCVGLLGCALIELSQRDTKPTPDEWKNATCEDARAAYSLSSNELLGEMLPLSTRQYWQMYRLGAGVFLAQYCPDALPPPAAKELP